mmetsp:Transcript_2627/g.2742  ORF Transcript_2627/g.2742 Transcript_2627/m.2742 type:complete len:194 (-) Transcript_2627:282-863(-)
MASSPPSSSARPSNDTIFQHLWALTTGNCPKDNPDVIMSHDNDNYPRKVHFHTSVKVILIPSRCEYEAAKLIKTLWWERDNYPLFKLDAVKEVLTIMQGNNSMTCKEAMKVLYQTPISDLDIDDKTDYPITVISDKKDTNGIGITPNPQSCLKDKSSTLTERPTNLSISEYGRRPIQKHLHPLAYMCETFVSY